MGPPASACRIAREWCGERIGQVSSQKRRVLGYHYLSTTAVTPSARSRRSDCIEEPQGQGSKRHTALSRGRSRPSAAARSAYKRLRSPCASDMWEIDWGHTRRRRCSWHLSSSKLLFGGTSWSGAYVSQGVLRALEEYGIPVDHIGGTVMPSYLMRSLTCV